MTEITEIPTWTRFAKPSEVANLRTLQAAGRQRFDDAGLELDAEEWRFTNINPLIQAAASAVLCGPSAGAEVETLLGANTLREYNAIELVFVNGRFAADLSTLGNLPPGLYVGPLSGMSRLAESLGTQTRLSKTPFIALNAAFLTDPAVVHVARGAAIDRPIHVLAISTASQPSMVHPRLLVVLEDGAKAQIAETYASHTTGDLFCNAVTEIILAQDAVLDHVSVNVQGDSTYHIQATGVSLGRSAEFITHAVTLDTKWTRNDLEISLDGNHAHATLNGAVLLTKSHFCDTHTLIRHEKPECTSHELYKHVIDDKAFGVFKGKILVRPGAQKTDAKQTNKTLLVSDSAGMESMPALEIYADDVKCTHGSTTGPLDEEMVFYLRSRGLSHEAARSLLTYAFAADVTRRIRIEAIRRRIEDYIAAQQDLPMDLRITESAAHDEAVRG